MNIFLHIYKRMPVPILCLLVATAGIIALNILFYGSFRDIGWSGFSKVAFAIGILIQFVGLGVIYTTLRRASGM